MADINSLQNSTRNITPQCKVVLYLWKTQSIFSDNTTAELADTAAFDISSRIKSVSYQKNMAEASGTFTISVANNADFKFSDDDKSDAFSGQRKALRSSGDWKDLVKRGTWCTIHMAQDGALDIKDDIEAPSIRPNAEGKYLRCVGFIERVTVRSELNESGGFDVTYELSGRDYGIIYEDTNIWHNMFQLDALLLKQVTTIIEVNQLNYINNALQTLHDLFFGAASVGLPSASNPKSLLSISRQWLVPSKLLRDLGMVDLSITGAFWGSLASVTAAEDSFYGIQPTQMGFITADITQMLSGGAWEKLNNVAVRQFHELFVETTDEGKLKLNFRPIPWAINKKNYSRVGRDIQYYLDVPTVTVPAIDVVNFEVGEDNHNRYNSFLVTIQSAVIGKENNIGPLKGRFPEHQSSSIQRYGFRPMHVSVPALSNNAALQNGLADEDLLLEYNYVLKDYWNFSIFAESGSMEIIGRNDIKVGKCLEPDGDVPYISGRRYYIEGYADNFSVGDNGAMEWTQTLSLTRGFEKTDLNNTGSGFRNRDNKFLKKGEYTKRGKA